MKSKSRLPSLDAALASGNTREFKRYVRTRGVPTAARSLGIRLSAPSEAVDVSLRANGHLFDPDVLRGICGAEDFLGFVLRMMNDHDRPVTDERKLAILRAMGPYLRAEHVKEVPVLKLGASGARYVASIVSILGNLPAWADAAVMFQDLELLERTTRGPFSRQLPDLWRDMPCRYTLDQAKFLLAHAPAPEAEADRHSAFQKLICRDADQAAMVAVLVQAWPRAAATFQIPPNRTRYFWSGKAIRVLLQAGASLDRQHWTDVFRWYQPSTFVAQIRELPPSTPLLIDWNQPNAAGQSFLEEIYLKWIYMNPAQRLPLLEKCLELKVDPSPLLKPIWQDKLSPDEKALLAAVAALPKAKLDALALPASLLPTEVVDLDLI
jgi:hypothetical protein